MVARWLTYMLIFQTAQVRAYAATLFFRKLNPNLCITFAYNVQIFELNYKNTKLMT